MDMLEMIEMVDRLDPHRVIHYKVTLEQLPQVRLFDPDEYPIPETHSSTQEYSFYDKDDVIGFLFDRDLFGWMVKEWNINHVWNSIDEFSIELYRNPTY